MSFDSLAQMPVPESPEMDRPGLIAPELADPTLSPLDEAFAFQADAENAPLEYDRFISDPVGMGGRWETSGLRKRTEYQPATMLTEREIREQYLQPQQERDRAREVRRPPPVGMPDIDNAAVNEEGPGMVITLMPSLFAKCTIRYPGSLIQGVPASEIIAIETPFFNLLIRFFD